MDKTKIIANHVLALSSIARNNAGVRSILINNLKHTYSELESVNADSISVSLFNDKYAIIIDGLKKEYHYKNKLFLNCFTSAFDTFSQNASNILTEFINKELNNEEK